MKKWRKMAAGFCAAAMAVSMSMPVTAGEVTDAVEAAADSEVADVTEAMLGLWQDAGGDIYGFYADHSFFGQWLEEEEDVVGNYALVSDGEYTSLALDFLTGEEPAAFLVVVNEAENKLELYDEEGEPFSELVPYDNPEDEFNTLYQTLGGILTECYMGKNDAGETFIYAGNDDGSYSQVLVIDAENNFASFIGEASYDEENDIITVMDEISNMSLGFSLIDNGDGTITMDLGDLGTASLEEASIANAVQGLKFCEVNCTPVN